MKYLSVCSGIEAATVAWHGLGWEPVAFAEIEAFPAAVLEHHYPTVPNLGDLTKYREWPEELLVDVDLLVGGTPCQAFSVAGLRRSLDDERGNLSLTYVNLFHHINEVRKRHGRSPAVALWENVPGVLSTKDNAFGCFIGGLLGCDEAPQTESGKWDKAGFLGSETVRVGYRVLDAQYFGVAQRRRRVFLVAVPCELVASLGERACPSEILSLRESVLGNPPTRGAAWEGVARATAAGLTSSGRGVERCGESRGQDDVVISERIGVDTYNQTLSDTSIPVRVGNAKDSLPAVLAAPPVCGTLSDGAHRGGGLTDRMPTRAESCPSVARTLTQRMHKGFDSTLDSQTPIVTHGGVFDGEPTCFHPTQDPICSSDGSAHAMGTGSKGVCFKPGQSEAAGGTFVVEGHPDPAYAISAGQQGKGGVFGSGRDSQDTFVSVAFKPSHFTRGKEGRPQEVTPPLSADADKVDQDTVVATPIDLRQASRGDKVTNNRSSGSGGPPGHGVGDSGDPAFTVSERGQAVAIDLQNVAIGGNIAGTLDTTRPSRGGGQAVAFTKAKRAQSSQDDESWIPGDVAPTQNQFDQGDTRATKVVAVGGECQHQHADALYTKGYHARQQNACSQEADSREVLSLLRQEVGEKDFAEWGLGILDSLQGEEVLRSGVLGEGDGSTEEVTITEAGREVVGCSPKGKKHLPEGRVSAVRKAGRERRASQRWKLSEQLAGELGAYLQELSHKRASIEAVVCDLWQASEGLRLLRDALPEVQEVGRSASCERQSVHCGSQGYGSEREEEVRGSGLRAVSAFAWSLRPSPDAEEARDARQAAEDEERNSKRNVGKTPLCVRRLVPTECEFLQGFPENYTLVTYRNKPAADGPRYRALGNSMAVPCMHWLGKRIHEATQCD